MFFRHRYTLYITSSSPVLLVHHATYTSFSKIATGASRALTGNAFAYVDCSSIIGVTPIVVPRVIITMTPKMIFLSFMRTFGIINYKCKAAPRGKKFIKLSYIPLMTISIRSQV